MAQLAEAGRAHELQILDGLVSEFGEWVPETGSGVARIKRADPSAEGLGNLVERTKSVLEAGADIVYQAGFFDGEFHGYADFLRPSPDGWVVADSKIARSAKAEALLQVVAYADQLESWGVSVAPTVELILGGGEIVAFELDGLMPDFRASRDRLRQLISEHRRGGVPAEWGAAGITFCGSCTDCKAAITATNDMLLVANIRKTQRAKLKAAGVHTLVDLADAESAPEGMSPSIFERLKGQASLQALEMKDGKVRYEIVDSGPILSLPSPSEGDLFFDFEGDPLYRETGSERWGLEYLWGVLPARKPDGNLGDFLPLWADNRTEEKQRLVEFLDLVQDLRSEHPGMHVYHYAPYEISALNRLVAEFQTHEEVLEDLKGDRVFVDLYATVRGSVLVSQPSYSIKMLEPLYMTHERQGLAAGGDSIVQYQLYREKIALGDQGAEKHRAELIRYNHYDCESTLELRDWLLRLVSGR